AGELDRLGQPAARVGIVALGQLNAGDEVRDPAERVDEPVLPGELERRVHLLRPGGAELGLGLRQGTKAADEHWEVAGALRPLDRRRGPEGCRLAVGSRPGEKGEMAVGAPQLEAWLSRLEEGDRFLPRLPGLGGTPRAPEVLAEVDEGRALGTGV